MYDGRPAKQQAITFVWEKQCIELCMLFVVKIHLWPKSFL